MAGKAGSPESPDDAVRPRYDDDKVLVPLVLSGLAEFRLPDCPLLITSHCPYTQPVVVLYG